ncbi:hypothetical protein ACTXT7_005365, partial [Hymenolepis weldensis]
RDEFMWTKRAQENHLMCAKPFLKKLKYPEEDECLWIFPQRKKLTSIKKSID